MAILHLADLQEGGDRRIFRHMLLYLLFPAHFERICSRPHKLRIIEVFGGRLAQEPDSSAQPSTPCELDQALLRIRRALEHEVGPKLDFYEDPIKPMWNPETPPNPEGKDDDAHLRRRWWIEKTIVRERPDRQSGDNALGRSLWSPLRSATGGDIYSAMRNVQAGDVVFHLTDNRAISGVSVVSGPADDKFVGLAGTSWADQAAYRVSLRDFQQLDPPLLRESFFDHEPFRTQLAQLASSGARGLFLPASWSSIRDRTLRKHLWSCFPY
jgi:hypothetical protein